VLSVVAVLSSSTARRQHGPQGQDAAPGAQSNAGEHAETPALSVYAHKVVALPTIVHISGTPLQPDLAAL
jgi:hypothetical protein